MSVEVSPFELAGAAAEGPVRTEGLARLYAERSAGQTIARDVDEEGPLRLRFPRIAAPGTLEAVLVNTGGGIVGGDRLQFDIEAGEGAAVAVTSQASEKIYRSAGKAAEISVRLAAAAGAQLAWLPQETILFDRARVTRSIDAEVAANASLTLCESVVFGRVAMGEAVTNGLLKDRWHIRRDGKLIFADALTLDGSIGAILARPATAAGAVATATLIQVAPDAQAKVDAVRTALGAHTIESGASAFDGMLIVRMLAGDGLALRAAILDTLSALGTVPPRAFLL
ncbi:MAG: urease accessory protein UreD [Bradyrhizobiaceae bacterium]|nr:urease accessory protein UreD [Bradyrhizobiaceae bacterium]